MPRNAAADVSTFLGLVDRVGWTWFFKRLSPNEVGATGTHQRAITVPRAIARTLFPNLATGINPRMPMPFELVSHGTACNSARVTHWNQGTRDEYHVTNLGGGRSPLFDPHAAGRLFVLAMPAEPGAVALAWLTMTPKEEGALEVELGAQSGKSAGIHQPVGTDVRHARRSGVAALKDVVAGSVVLRAVGQEVTEPDPTGTAEAFSQSGYRIELAVADLIDNSVDAKARNVLVRFVTDGQAIQRIVVADDGRGMNEKELRRAMQYGARIERHTGDLGKYGVGMKSASLSQCRSLSVLTRSAGIASARRWTEQSIRSGWRCDVLDPAEASRMLDLPWGSLNVAESGTLIVWDGLDRLQSERDGVERSVDALFKLLNLHLGLVFHRFIASGALRIHIDRVEADTWDAGLPATVDGLDPFDYPVTGVAEFPQRYELDLGESLAVSMTAHIWPPKSKLPGYRLGGGRVASRQGLYFYRNDRLIQAGGWNGWRESDNEPHLSLARVAVDLPVAADRAFGLSLQKSGIDVPPGFAGALNAAKSKGGVSFHDYVASAIDAYRSANEGPVDREATPIPGVGLPTKMRSRSRRILAGRDPNVRPFRFVWASLPEEVVVEVDRGADAIRLNSRHRRTLLQGHRASQSDAPLVKLLLFFALRSHLARERSSASQRREVAAINETLRAAIDALESRD